MSVTKLGARGPAARPTALRLLEGNPGRRPLNFKEPKFTLATVEDAPEWLQGNALQIWRDLTPQLITLGLLTTGDIPTFARYCDMLDKWLIAKRFLDNNGLAHATYDVRTVTEMHRGKKRQRVERTVVGSTKYPHVSIYKEFGDSLTKLEAQFGLTPSSRSRVIAPDLMKGKEEEPDDDFDD